MSYRANNSDFVHKNVSLVLIKKYYFYFLKERKKSGK